MNWISIDDSLPDDDRKVLICMIRYDNGEMDIEVDRFQDAFGLEEKIFINDILFGEVIAWQELPEKPYPSRCTAISYNSSIFS